MIRFCSFISHIKRVKASQKGICNSISEVGWIRSCLTTNWRFISYKRLQRSPFVICINILSEHLRGLCHSPVLSNWRGQFWGVSALFINYLTKVSIALNSLRSEKYGQKWQEVVRKSRVVPRTLANTSSEGSFIASGHPHTFQIVLDVVWSNEQQPEKKSRSIYQKSQTSKRCSRLTFGADEFVISLKVPTRKSVVESLEAVSLAEFFAQTVILGILPLLQRHTYSIHTYGQCTMG